MKSWAATSKYFPGAERNTLAAEDRVGRAYRAVFCGTPSQQDQQIVLADLHAFCGYTQVSHPSMSSRALWLQEGKRTAYSRIHGFLTLSPEDVSALEHAARLEAATIQSFDN